MNSVQIDLLAADVGAQADDVLFVRGDDAQFELLEESAERGKSLALLAADLHREHHVRF
jgi:uncharacterized protein with PhoU and TrkA domain